MDGIESPEHESDSASPTAFPPLDATNPKADIDSLSHAFAPGGMTDEAAAMPSPCPSFEQELISQIGQRAVDSIKELIFRGQ